MPHANRCHSLAVGLALAAALTGCGSEATDSDRASLVASEPGWLIIDWTIAGQNNAEQCDQGHAATVAVSVATENGVAGSVSQDPCMAFNATITLDPGSYAASAELLDGAGNPLTAPISMPPFEIASGSPLRVPLEFSQGSFFSPPSAR